MSKIPAGRGMYNWQIPRCGSINEIADQAKAANLGHVFVKIADGTASYGIVGGVDLAKQLADALKARGIEPWGWQYVYLYDPVNEAAKAIQRINETGVVGFAIDAESECKGHPVEASQYCQELRNALPVNYPIGLASYRFPVFHRELPWKEFREHCDFDMPQLYWVGSHDPGEQLRQSFNEFALMTPKLAYVPTGYAYRYEKPPYYEPTIGEIKEFKQTCADLMMSSYNFWEWYDAKVLMPEIWDAINGNEVPEPPTPPRVKVNVASLNIRSTPAYFQDNRNVIGYTTRDKVWQVESTVTDTLGRTWDQVGAAAFIAGWLCVEI